MSPKKTAIDNKPTVVNSVTRVPGQVGWGIERKHLRARNVIITDDSRVASYPIEKVHLREIDGFYTGHFTRYEGDRAAILDAKLGSDPKLYN